MGLCGDGGHVLVPMGDRLDPFRRQLQQEQVEGGEQLQLLQRRLLDAGERVRLVRVVRAVMRRL